MDRVEVSVTIQKRSKDNEEKKIVWVNQPPPDQIRRRIKMIRVGEE